jgi:hypothetical protein
MVGLAGPPLGADAERLAAALGQIRRHNSGGWIQLPVHLQVKKGLLAAHKQRIVVVSCIEPVAATLPGHMGSWDFNFAVQACMALLSCLLLLPVSANQQHASPGSLPSQRRHSQLSGSRDLEVWAASLVSSVRGAWRSHVVGPLAGVKDELFNTFRR